MTLILNLPPEAEAGLNKKATQNGLAPQDYVVGLVLRDLPKENTSSFQTRGLSEAESKLLTLVNRGIAAELWERYDALMQKRDARTLTQEEHAELLILSDRIEEENAVRIGHAAELARLRGVTLPALLHTLGIGPRSGNAKP